ncbi:MAG: YceI family protein [Acidimicrobiales bacterium]|nr:YceI family protein [Acidimicrobiales bacterium]
MTLPLSSGTWIADPAHTTVGFSVRHLAISRIRGRFSEFEASLVVGESLADTSLNATIEMASLDTGDPNRDAHVKAGSDLFDADTHPQMVFKADQIVDTGSGYEAVGSLTVRGVEKPLTLAAEFNGVAENPFSGATHAGFKASGSIDRTEFGIDFQVPLSSGGVMLSNQIDIEIDAQLVLQTD